MTQIKYFKKDIYRLLGKYKIRILHIWLSRIFWGLLLYRFERSMYLLMGKPYSFLRVILLPIFNLIQAYSNMDINYKADIKGGIKILHPSVGIVISGYSIIGENLTLTGGNIIGGRAGTKSGGIIIGNGCSIGANAVILGPIKLGNKITIGASACVVTSCEVDNTVLIGIPAKPVSK